MNLATGSDPTVSASDPKQTVKCAWFMKTG
jgi:predicted amidohydrolase YtcJ